ncbi:MAG TPA: hypothetical protein PKH65_09465 [Bacteroidia bacterium]|nr:hypothetical protein [Bacteroidia bacterium]
MVRISVLFLIVLFSSCASTVPFTQNARENLKLTEEELKGIQFYTSSTIVLKRGEQVQDKKTEDGTLTITQGKDIDEVVIKAGTPCVVEKVVDVNTLAIRFDDSSGKYLVFGSIKQRNGYYSLMARDWSNGVGVVNYGDKYYKASMNEGQAILTYKVKQIKQIEKKQEVVKGAKL